MARQLSLSCTGVWPNLVCVIGRGKQRSSLAFNKTQDYNSLNLYAIHTHTHKKILNDIGRRKRLKQKEISKEVHACGNSFVENDSRVTLQAMYFFFFIAFIISHNHIFIHVLIIYSMLYLIDIMGQIHTHLLFTEPMPDRK